MFSFISSSEVNNDTHRHTLGVPGPLSNLYGNVAQTHIQRGQATFNRLNPWARGHGTQIMPTSQLSSSTLAEHQNGGPGMSGDDEQITVCWQFRTSKAKSLDSSLGLCSRNWSINMLMTGTVTSLFSQYFWILTTCNLTDIKNEVLTQINPDWSRKWGAPLQLQVFIRMTELCIRLTVY